MDSFFWLWKIPNQSTVVAVNVCVCVCVCLRVCSTGFKRGGTSVHILDIHFYCNRKHLGQMLPCSEVTCGFQTGHSFPISAWEPGEREREREGERERERERERLLNEVIIVSSLLPTLPPSSPPPPSPVPCIAFPVRTATRQPLFTPCSFP